MEVFSNAESKYFAFVDKNVVCVVTPDWFDPDEITYGPQYDGPYDESHWTLEKDGKTFRVFSRYGVVSTLYMFKIDPKIIFCGIIHRVQRQYDDAAIEAAYDAIKDDYEAYLRGAKM